MNCTTGEFSKSGISRLSRAPETRGAHALGVSRLEQVIEQNGRESDAEGGSENSGVLSRERMFECIAEQIEAQQKKEQSEKSDQAAECSGETSADNQRLCVTRCGAEK